MGTKRAPDEVLNISVGGKKYTLRRSVLTADPQSKLTEWFKPNSTKAIAQDKAGNFFLDRDGRTFRHVANYLRMKRDKQMAHLALPSKPDELARLIAEADAMQLEELREMCTEMLNKYQREEMGYIVAFTRSTINALETWQDEKRQTNTKTHHKDTDDW